jgi:hypothetical protein
MPRSSCIHRILPPFGPLDGARWCSLEGSASGPPPPVVSPPGSTRLWWCCRSCRLLAAVRGAQPRGGWRSSAITRLQGFSSCSPTATSHRWSSTRMTTSLVVERSEPGCGLPPLPQLQGCSSSSLGWKASRVRVLPSAWAGDPLLPPAFGGEGHSPALRRRRTSATRGRPAVGTVSCRVSGSSAWMALVLPPALPPAAWSGHVCLSTARATVAPCAGLPHPRLLPRRWPHCSAAIRGVVQDVVCRGGWQPRSWMVLSSLPWGDGSEDLFTRAEATAIAGKPLVRRWPLSSVLRWSPPLVRLPTAEVVASASETVSATCRRASDSLALMASLSPPVGGWGRGPLRNGARIEATITIVTPSWGIPQGQWPQPSSVTLLVSGSLYLQSRDGTRTPLESRCNTFVFCKVLLSTISSISTYLCTDMLLLCVAMLCC